MGVKRGKKCKKCGADNYVAVQAYPGWGLSTEQHWSCVNCGVKSTSGCCGTPDKVGFCWVPFVFVALGFCSKTVAYFANR